MEDHVSEIRAMSRAYGPETEALCERVLCLPKFSTWSASASEKTHHHGKGGLARHTHEVAMLCVQNTRFFNGLGYGLSERDAFLAAVFHDVGKIWDYTPTNPEMSQWANTEHKHRIHHITRSALFWSQAVRETGLLAQTEDAVLHAILSHHGLREWGSPVEPKTAIAWILHLSDNMSARVFETKT